VTESLHERDEADAEKQEDRMGEMKRLPPIRNVRRRKVLVLAGLLVLSSSLGAAAHTGSAPSFAAARSHATGRTPVSVAIGDLNGDGKPDLVTTNYDAYTVSVLLSRGEGSFRAKHDYRVDFNPKSVTIGDLSGDGKLDLATANEDADTVSVLLNRGNGSFAAKRDYGAGHGPVSVAIGDLNGDRKPDLATANEGGIGNTVSVLLNRGDGSFQAKLDYETDIEPSSVAIGDLNGDFKPDLATANSSVFVGQPDTVSVLLNSGDGSFHARLDYLTGSEPYSVAIGDLSGDGKPDLATANARANTVSVLVNGGDGTLLPKRDYRAGRGSRSVAIGDLNGDGKVDLATANEDVGTVSVLANRGGGKFGAKLDYRTGRDPQEIAIGHLNGDSKLDLATANWGSTTVSVLLNTTGLCAVPNIRGRTLPAAKRTIARANCRVGRIRRAYSKSIKRGRVISEKPKPGTVLPSDGRVDLTVSRGRGRS
jgi:hypothetical protein